MGGTIGVIIREEDGKIHKMARWTNSLPGFTESIHFINKEPNHLKNYLKVFYEMELDYKKNKKTKKFKHNMTDVYIPYSGHIAPLDYGLVVIDYQTNNVLHCQGYSSLNVVLSSEIEYLYRQDKHTQESVQELVDARKIKCLLVFDKDENVKELQEIPVEYKTIKDKTDVERLTIVLNEKINEEDYHFNNGYKIDMSPWTFTRFKESKEGFIELKEEIKKLGLKITKEDEKIWKEYINCRFIEEK